MYSADFSVFRALRLLEPYDIDAPKRLVGGGRDGSYVLVDRPAHGDVLSIGVERNDDFDLAMAEAGHTVHLYDHTVEGPPHRHERFRFNKVGICAPGDEGADMMSLGQIIDRAGLSPHAILKMDIEGGEYGVFAAATPGELGLFDQILVEIHWLSRLAHQNFQRVFSEAMQNINAQFTLFHVHANNYSGVHIAGGFPVADVLELSYVRSSLVNRSASRTIYPARPNRANLGDAPDIPLLFYPFMPAKADPSDISDMIARIEQDAGIDAEQRA